MFSLILLCGEALIVLPQLFRKICVIHGCVPKSIQKRFYFGTYCGESPFSKLLNYVRVCEWSKQADLDNLTLE